MADREPAIQFAPKQPIDVQLKYDTPKTGGEGEKSWIMYGCTYQGKERIFWGTQNMRKRLEKFGARTGSWVRIVKVADKKPFKLWVNNGDGWVEAVDDDAGDEFAPDNEPRGMSQSDNAEPGPPPQEADFAPKPPEKAPESPVDGDLLDIVIIYARMVMARRMAQDDGHEVQNSLFIQLNRDNVTPPQPMRVMAFAEMVEMGIVEEQKEEAPKETEEEAYPAPDPDNLTPKDELPF